MYRNGVGFLLSSLRGEFLRSGHTDMAEITDDMLPLIFAVFGVFLEHRAEWAELVLYLQQANKPEYLEGEGDGPALCAPREIYANHRMLSPRPGLLEALRRAGAIVEIGMSFTRCRLRFVSARVLGWLCDCGAWLELYLYAKIRRSGLADDVVIDAVLSWDDDADDDDTINEVDVLAAKGSRLFLFSCKTGALSAAALNELAVLVQRFGGDSARGVLATTAWRRDVPRALAMRAEAMGLRFMTRDDLEKGAVDEWLRRLFGGR